MLDHVRRNARRSGLKKSCRERLAWTSARGKVRGGLSGLIGDGVEIQNLRIGVDRRDAVFVGLCLHVAEHVVALLHLYERIADAGAILSVAGKGWRNRPGTALESLTRSPDTSPAK